MIKKILPLSIFLLLVVVIILLGLQNMLNNSKTKQTSSIQPTLFQGKTGAYTPQKTTPIKTNPNNTESKQLTQDELVQQLPIYSPDFSLEYSDRLQKYVLVTQSDEGKVSYDEWLTQNPSYTNELQKEKVVVTKQSVEELHTALDYASKNKKTPEKKAQEDGKAFSDTLNILMNLPFLFMQSTTQTPDESPTPTPGLQTLEQSPTAKPNEPTPKKNAPAPAPSTKYTYYSQCDGPYDEKPLPNGCTVCEAGCGPTSVAMILSSYVDKSLNPLKTIDLMSKAGVRIGCYGSYISEIYSYLAARGDLKVSDFIIPSENGLTAKEVAKDLQGYTKSGWTVFVLANFKKDGGGHYFWVTDVKDNGDILAYDPYYGKQQSAPISENRYTPAPYYRYAFAIKKI